MADLLFSALPFFLSQDELDPARWQADHRVLAHCAAVMSNTAPKRRMQVEVSRVPRGDWPAAILHRWCRAPGLSAAKAALDLEQLWLWVVLCWHWLSLAAGRWTMSPDHTALPLLWLTGPGLEPLQVQVRPHPGPAGGRIHCRHAGAHPVRLETLSGRTTGQEAPERTRTRAALPLQSVKQPCCPCLISGLLAPISLCCTSPLSLQGGSAHADPSRSPRHGACGAVLPAAPSEVAEHFKPCSDLRLW